ncbi:unnamed protein product [Moneuplotes crassus]|uniref:Kinesin motor domain-containing protein n=1 Tax=Euplotes crassus TaxID=5936 RepID=A0AAD2D3M7_EUPCR|nr:unnamed protein product [Moneuplotes crassus]
MTSVKVAVRVRPFNGREKNMSSRCIIEMQDNMTKITDPDSGKEKKFYFDYSYWSHDGYTEDSEGILSPNGPGSNYADQDKVFNDLGIGVLDNAWKGYHTCLFAYGQTGSGKSYSIVGYGKNEGIIPKACREIFERISDARAKPSNITEFQVTISMIEIYNEKVHDLFQPPNKREKAGLKVRENKGEVFVDGLKKVPVESYEEIEKQISIGTSNRTIASTNMNSTSSRAHTVTTITFKQTVMENGKPTNQKRSDINLVDLAGSERQSGTGATGERLKEGSNINKSLSFLGKCITVLAEKSTGKSKGKVVVPYRESQLTRILQNALGGNSKTSMIAALSPASVNYDETLSTLRYANQVKAIKNVAKINESAHDKLIRELREENERLKKMMDKNGDPRQDLISFNDNFSDKCYLMNINEDPLLTGQVKHILEEGKNSVGKATRDSSVDIKIGGTGIGKKHCGIQYDKGSGVVSLIPNDEDPQKYKTVLNGEMVDSKVQLAHSDKVLFGNHNLFTIIFPGQEVGDDETDYESIMKFMNKDAINQFTDGTSDREIEEQMEKMRRKMEEEKAELDAKLKAEKAKMIEQKKKLAKQMEAQRLKLLEEYKSQKDSEERAKLQEELKKQQEETEKIKKEQKEKEKQFEAEKKKALKEMEDKKREDHKKEMELVQKKDLEQKLTKLIPQLNEVNEICHNLGRYTYAYEPHIITDILPDGRRVPKAVVKAYPDSEKSFYNVLSYDEFEDKMYRIKEKWENVQYDIEHGDSNAELELEPDEKEADIFGLSISNDDKLIGNVYIFCDSIASLLETSQDKAPIINAKGENRGYLTYSLSPSAFDDMGGNLNLNHYESISSLLNKTLNVDFKIHKIEDVPEKYSHEVYCTYQWVDESAEKFETHKEPDVSKSDFNYTANHDLFISNYVAENLQYSIFMIAVYGKLPDKEMKGLVEGFAARPQTAALLKNNNDNNEDEPFYEEKGGDQEVMKLDDGEKPGCYGEENERIREEAQKDPERKCQIEKN